MQKMSQAANNMRGMFDNISTKVFQGTPNDKGQAAENMQYDGSQQQMPRNYADHLKFSDDEDE